MKQKVLLDIWKQWFLYMFQPFITAAFCCCSKGLPKDLCSLLVGLPGRIIIAEYFYSFTIYNSWMPFTNHCCPRVVVSHVSMASNYLICVLYVMLHTSDHKLAFFSCVIVLLLNLSIPGPKNPAAELLWLFRFLFANCNLASLFLVFFPSCGEPSVCPLTK